MAGWDARLIKLCSPRWMCVLGNWSRTIPVEARGGKRCLLAKGVREVDRRARRGGTIGTACVDLRRTCIDEIHWIGVCREEPVKVVTGGRVTRVGVGSGWVGAYRRAKSERHERPVGGRCEWEE